MTAQQVENQDPAIVDGDVEALGHARYGDKWPHWSQVVCQLRRDEMRAELEEVAPRLRAPVIAQRDQARGIAVRLEEENARLVDLFRRVEHVLVPLNAGAAPNEVADDFNLDDLLGEIRELTEFGCPEHTDQEGRHHVPKCHYYDPDVPGQEVSSP